MPSNVTTLQGIVSQLEPIDIEKPLERFALLNAVSGAFLFDGNNMMFVTDNYTDGWIYFKDNSAVAAFAGELTGVSAIKKILEIDFGVVSFTKDIDSPEIHMQCALKEFMLLSRETVGSIDYEPEETRDLQGLPSSCKGYVMFAGDSLSRQYNLVAATVPVEYLAEMCGDSKDGLFCRIRQHENDESYFSIKFKDSFWIFKLFENSSINDLNKSVKAVLEKFYDGN